MMMSCVLLIFLRTIYVNIVQKFNQYILEHLVAKSLCTQEFYIILKRKTKQKPTPMPFCTVSANITHYSCALRSHLYPIFYDFREKFPFVKKIHFIVNNPSTQYRNKTISYLLTKMVPIYCLWIHEVTWNYSESGHGKGALDGVGTVLKQTADKVVARSKDIIIAEELVKRAKKQM